MKILHVTPTYLPAVRYGGPIWSVHGLCKALAAQGHQVDVVTTNVDGQGVSPVPMGTPVARDGVNVWYFPCPALRRLYWSPAMARWLLENVHQYDIVHGHSVFLYPTSAAFRVARRRGVPYVLSPRGMLVPELVKAKSSAIKKTWITLFERTNLRRAAAVHLTSATERRALADMRLDFGNTCVVANGVEPAQPYDFARLGADVAACVSRPGYALYFGRLSWKKGIDDLLRQFRDALAARLVVAGNDDEGIAPRLQQLASELGIGDRVDFIVRNVAGDEKAALFRHAAVFVLPSRSENFGNTVVEAMSYALPVVVTPEVGAAEIVREAKCGLVSPVAGFAGSINGLLENTAAARQCGAAGEVWTREHLLWPAVATAMANVYASAVGGRVLRSAPG